MKTLSIDVGLKNLGWAIIEEANSEIRVLHCGVDDLMSRAKTLEVRQVQQARSLLDFIFDRFQQCPDIELVLIELQIARFGQSAVQQLLIMAVQVVNPNAAVKLIHPCYKLKLVPDDILEHDRATHKKSKNNYCENKRVVLKSCIRWLEQTGQNDPRIMN